MSQGEYLLFKFFLLGLFMDVLLAGFLGSAGSLTQEGTFSLVNQPPSLLLRLGVWCISIVFAYVWWGTDVRRFHDLGVSGWYLMAFYAIQIVIVVGIISFLLAGRSGQEVVVGPAGRYYVPVKKSAWTIANCLKVLGENGWLRWSLVAVNLFVFVLGNGTEGPNKYGPDPRMESHGMKADELGANDEHPGRFFLRCEWAIKLLTLFKRVFFYCVMVEGVVIVLFLVFSPSTASGIIEIVVRIYINILRGVIWAFLLTNVFVLGLLIHRCVTADLDFLRRLALVLEVALRIFVVYLGFECWRSAYFFYELLYAFFCMVDYFVYMRFRNKEPDEYDSHSSSTRQKEEVTKTTQEVHMD